MPACPKRFRLATLAGADTVIVPAMPQEAWELRTGLLERSAENRVNLLVAVQPGGVRQQFRDLPAQGLYLAHPLGASGLSTVGSPIRPRPVPGAEPGITPVEIHPRWAENKVVSLGTDLLAGRPWQLLDPICKGEGISP